MMFGFLKTGLPVLVVAIFVSAIGAQAQLSPMEYENRIVTKTDQSNSALVIDEPMVWLDTGPLISPSRGVRFLAGKYVLEAEDADYFYYRSPEPIEYRIFENGQLKKDKFIPGGIYFSKALISLVPAGVYMTTDETHKTLTWKLGLDFVHMEGTKWRRTDEPGNATEK